MLEAVDVLGWTVGPVRWRETGSIGQVHHQRASRELGLTHVVTTQREVGRLFWHVPDHG